ncbi:hypothetical protein SAMN06295998_101473 [Primorskyibacter flagellatus]|uniref:Uncharacterized protein n=1 Tax=Primorskyibacter flagellatus TaxID=1387277 RepID=A0A1W1ZD79_9RHOB|nr:hypothetical protein SAMN06295998_101473 [Primorskyibacter flagellatus]
MTQDSATCRRLLLEVRRLFLAVAKVLIFFLSRKGLRGSAMRQAQSDRSAFSAASDAASSVSRIEACRFL